MTAPYAVVTPLHNELENLPRLVESMHAQTVRPERWVLVENGSTDGSDALARSFAAEHSYIHVVVAQTSLERERGAPIVQALNEGFRELDRLPAVIGQVDADLSFPTSYFERLLLELERDPRLGIVSGSCHELSNGVWRERFSTGSSAWGAARLYRRECLEQVLPLVPRTGWDAIDVAQANARGWRTMTVRENPFYHHRREASRVSSRWSAWVEQGAVSHYLGYRPSYLILRALFRARRDPGALALVLGYAAEAARRRPQCSVPGVREWVRGQQRLRYLLRRAAEARGVGAEDPAL